MAGGSTAFAVIESIRSRGYAIAGAMSEGELSLRLLAAAGFGVLLGAEREALHKPAGLRTHMIVCTAAALLTASSLALGDQLGVSGQALRVARVSSPASDSSGRAPSSRPATASPG
jgi:hypothetical protein